MQIISSKTWNSIQEKISGISELQQQVKSLQSQTVLTSYINYNNAIYPNWGIFRELEAYRVYDDIYSIISMLSQTAALVPFYGYEIVDDDAKRKFDKFNGIQKKYWQSKALEDLDEGDPVLESVKNPHETLGQFEFFEALYTYLFLTGEVFLYKETIEYGVNKGKTKFHFLLPQNVTVFISLPFPQAVVGYRYVLAAQTLDFTPDEVIHIKYFDPLWCNGSQWRGFSPLKALCKRLTRIDDAMDVSVAQLQNGGVPGIVYDKTGDFDAIEKSGARKTNFNKFLNDKSNKGAPYFANGEMGYIAIGAALADLKVEELAKIDFKKLCNAYHTPDQLFNNDDGAKYDNMQSAEKRLYTSAILPNCYRVRDAFQRGFVDTFTDKKRFIDADISGVSCLQEDVSKQAEALGKMWWVTPNEKREIQKFDKSEDESMDKFIVPTGVQFLEDLAMVEDIPNPSKDYNA